MDAVYTRYRDNNNPSFSSTLLDEIYRSIDEQQPTVSRKTKSTKNSDCFRGDFDENRCFRGGLIRKWMEDEVVGRKSAAADLDRSSIRLCVNSSSSSSDCSSAGHGGFCSSEGEFFRPRPIRTGGGINQREGFGKRESKTSSYGFGHGGLEEQKVVIKQESKFVKTKSKAMKIYSDLKKVKQPISPGGRLSSFLNSLFVTGNAKKSKTSASATVSAATGDGGCTAVESCRLDRKSKSANASTCSSASSFSRSCLSNTPSSSSRGKSSNGLKRSVRFYPVSEVVDEYCQPCGHKSLNEEEDEDETGLRSVRFVKHSTNEEVRMKQTARNVLLKSYQKKIDRELDSKHDGDANCSDDGKSDSSSDLFELDNLAAIGMEKYREELPVYETTHLDTNIAIAYGRVR